MNYEEFKMTVKDEFMNYLPGEYQHLSMDIRPIEKVNATREGMTFMDPNQDSTISPTIYLDDLYQIYLRDEDYRTVFENVAADVVMMMEKSPVKSALDYQDAKDNIVFQLINTEQNKEMLAGMPHREFHDLSIIYRWVVGMDENGLQSAVIKNDLMERLGLQEEQMFRLAVENYKTLLSPSIRSMDEIMRESFLEEGMPEELAELMFQNRPADEMMWVISNGPKINGAASMLYDDILQQVAKEVDSNLYILPSSVHETIAVSVNMGEPYELAKLVNEVNMGQVDLEERLSNQVYHYDKELHKLTMATDTPLKRLDGLVAEPQLIYEASGRVR